MVLCECAAAVCVVSSWKVMNKEWRGFSGKFAERPAKS